MALVGIEFVIHSVIHIQMLFYALRRVDKNNSVVQEGFIIFFMFRGSSTHKHPGSSSVSSENRD